MTYPTLFCCVASAQVRVLDLYGFLFQPEKVDSAQTWGDTPIIVLEHLGFAETVVGKVYFIYFRYWFHRIGWWENLQETPLFDGKNHGFRLRFSPTNQSIDG